MGDEAAEIGVLREKLKVADQEMEDAKEALRIERAKMTREKKQVPLLRAHFLLRRVRPLIMTLPVCCCVFSRCCSGRWTARRRRNAGPKTWHSCPAKSEYGPRKRKGWQALALSRFLPASLAYSLTACADFGSSIARTCWDGD